MEKRSMSGEEIEDRTPELNPRQKLVLYMSDVARNFAMRWADDLPKKIPDPNLRAMTGTRRIIHVYRSGSQNDDPSFRSVFQLHFAQNPSEKQKWFAFSMVFGIGTFCFTTMDGFVKFIELAESSAGTWSKSSFWMMFSNVKGIEYHE